MLSGPEKKITVHWAQSLTENTEPSQFNLNWQIQFYMNSTFNNGHCYEVALKDYINSGYKFYTYKCINLSPMSNLGVVIINNLLL